MPAEFVRSKLAPLVDRSFGQLLTLTQTLRSREGWFTTQCRAARTHWRAGGARSRLNSDRGALRAPAFPAAASTARALRRWAALAAR